MKVSRDRLSLEITTVPYEAMVWGQTYPNMEAAIAAFIEHANNLTEVEGDPAYRRDQFNQYLANYILLQQEEEHDRPGS